MNNTNVKTVNLNNATQHQHHGVLLHLPAQHGEDHQRRVFAAERRPLLRRRHLQHVQAYIGQAR
jgi:hypothetical protein